MTDRLFVYGALKTGGPAWFTALAPQIGTLAHLQGYRLLEVNQFPVMVPGGVDDWVHGELMTVEDLPGMDAGQGAPDLYSRVRVVTMAGEEAQAYVLKEVPEGAEVIPDGTWRHWWLTKGLNHLAQSWADKSSRTSREEVIKVIRDGIRPLVQANWVSIPWRTGANTSEWKWCQEYLKRLSFAAEIGL